MNLPLIRVHCSACSVVQRGAACCSVLQHVAAYCSVLQSVDNDYRTFFFENVYISLSLSHSLPLLLSPTLQLSPSHTYFFLCFPLTFSLILSLSLPLYLLPFISKLQLANGRTGADIFNDQGMMQCVTVCCSVLQRVAVYCSTPTVALAR